MLRSGVGWKLLGGVLGLTAAIAKAEEKPLSPVPDAVIAVLDQHCFKCHDADMAKGGINLDHTAVDWGAEGSAKLWERALNAVTHHQMPPVNRKQLTPDEKQTLLGYLDEQLTRHTPIGGTLPSALYPSAAASSVQRPARLPPVIAFHGTEDLVVPLQRARESVAELKSVGYPAELREYAGLAHSISPQEFADVVEQLGRLSDATSSALR